MATSSSWRTGGGGGGGGGGAGSSAAAGPRWSQGPNNGNHNHSAAAVPRSASSNVIRSPGVAATPAPAAFPPLGAKGTAAGAPLEESDSVQRDRMMYLLVGLVGNTVVATTRSGVKYVGILSSTTVPDDGNTSLGVVLSSAQQILNEAAGLGPLKKMLIIKGDDLVGLSAKDVGLDVPVSMSNANRSGFRTDTEISKNALEPFGEGRTLQKWADDPDFESIEADGAFGESTGGAISTGGLGGWDQFAANETRFGVKSNYDEAMYTTKLDKSAKDYKDREKKADQLAKEIMGSTATNIHVAEERNISGEGEEGQTEEDRYGAVVRGPNAYVPPAARRAAAAAAAAGAQSTIKANGAAREDKASGSQSPSVSIPTITSTPAVKEGGAETGGSQQPGPDAVGEFRQFVTSERERMEKKKAALAKKEKDSKLADLKNWGDKFKLKFPVSEEGAVTEGKEGEAALKPRDPSLKKSLSPPTSHALQQQQQQKVTGEGSGGGSLSVVASPNGGSGAKTADGANLTSAATKARMAETKAALAKMTVPKIPPFNPENIRAKQAEGSPALGSTEASATSKSSFKMSAKASSFKPFNPNAAAFTPGGPATAAPASTASPRVAASEASTTATSPLPASARLPLGSGQSSATPANPFFGNRVLKKTATPLHVREDFNPFKNGKVPESQTVGPTWGFTGKGHRYLFHAIPAEENHSHMNQLPPHPPPPMGPIHNMVPMGMHPHGANMGHQGPPTPAPPPHLQQQHNQAAAAAAAAMASNNGFYMAYGGPGGAGQGAPPYRFQGQQGQPMQQMPANYGQMPPHYLPFSPPMQPPNGPPVYSPQMANMYPPGAAMHNMGVPPGPLSQQVPPPRNGAGPPPSQAMQGKAPPPPHMYYSNQPPPFVPNSAGPPGAMSPIMRHQQQPPPLQQQQQQPAHHHNNGASSHSTAPSQSGSAAG